jgi:hypothetical protein
MPFWLIPLILLGIGGAVVYEKRQTTTPTAVGPDPKTQYNKGFADGAAAGSKDLAAGVITAAVPMTKDALTQQFKNPAGWMNDAIKSYTLGYGLGYYSTFSPSTSVPAGGGSGTPPPSGGGSGLPGPGPGHFLGLPDKKPTPTSPTKEGGKLSIGAGTALGNFLSFAEPVKIARPSPPSKDEAYALGNKQGQLVAVNVASAFESILPSDLVPKDAHTWSDDLVYSWSQGYADGYKSRYLSAVGEAAERYRSFMSSVPANQPGSTDLAYQLGNLYGSRMGYAIGSGVSNSDPSTFTVPVILTVAPTGWDQSIQDSFNQGYNDGLVKGTAAGSAQPVCPAGYAFDVTTGLCNNTSGRAEAPAATHGSAQGISSRISPEWRGQVPSWFTDRRFYG